MNKGILILSRALKEQNVNAKPLKEASIAITSVNGVNSNFKPFAIIKNTKPAKEPIKENCKLTLMPLPFILR